MTAEGTFPKVAGDVVYASEYNGIRTKVIGNIESEESANCSGTTAYTTIGSIISYSGTDTSMQIADMMNAHAFLAMIAVSTNQELNARFRISGADLDITSTAATQSAHSYDFIDLNHIFTSGAITASGGNVGTNYDMSVEAKSDTATLVHKSGFIVLGN